MLHMTKYYAFNAGAISVSRGYAKNHLLCSPQKFRLIQSVKLGIKHNEKHIP